MKNEATILLSKGKLWVQGCKKNNNNPVPIKLITLLAKTGYVLSEEFQELISPEDEKRLLYLIDSYLSRKYGIGRKWKSVWETPYELPKDEDTQKIIQLGLYMNPDILKEIHESRQEVPDFWKTNNWAPSTVLEPGYDSDLSEITKSLLGSPIPLCPEDWETLDFIFRNREDLVSLPAKIPVKENLVFALSFGFGKEYISGVTDILRVAFYLSGVTFGRTQRFRLSKKHQRIFLGLLEEYLGKKEMRWCLQDSKKYKEQWKLLAYHCHPKETKYSKVYEFFGKIQDSSEEMRFGWSSKLQRAYDLKNYDEVLRLLSQRPSEFIRRYDSLLRGAWDSGDAPRLEKIQDFFMKISDTPKKVLFELYRHFDRRGEEIPRSFLDKFGVRHMYDPLPSMSQDLIDIAKTNIIQAIKNQWGTKDTFKGEKVYLDLPEDIDFSLSFRGGVSDKTDPMYQGQKIYFPTTGMMRFFSQWFDPTGDEDLDLHAWLVDDKVETLIPVSWDSSFCSTGRFVTHSGDVRHQTGDCAEYVTVDYTKEIEYTWMLVRVQNYDGPKLCNVENWIGVSEVSGYRSKNCSSWIPDKSSTIFRGKVMSEAKDLTAFIVNLKEGWMKLILEGSEQSSLSQNMELLKQYILPCTLKVKNLISLFIESTGGSITRDPKEASIYLGIEDYMSGKIHEYLLG